MNIKNKILVFVLIIIAITLMSIGTLLLFSEKNDNKSSFVNTATKYLEKLTDEIINGTNKNNLMKLLRLETITESEIMTGDNMYLVSNFTEEQVNMYNLSSYIQASEILRENLEKQIQTNFSYKIQSIEKKHNNTIVTISYKAFNYNSYLNDLGVLEGELLTLAGHDLNNLEESDKVLTDIYKAKIKSASILNNYLDRYKNNDKLTTTIKFVNNNIDDSSEELLNYFYSLKGYNYEMINLTGDSEFLNIILKNINLIDPLSI